MKLEHISWSSPGIYFTILCCTPMQTRGERKKAIHCVELLTAYSLALVEQQSFHPRENPKSTLLLDKIPSSSIWNKAPH